MKLKTRILKLRAGRPVAILHKSTAEKLSVNIDDRITLSSKNKKIISIVDIATGILKKEEVAVSEEIVESLKIKENDCLEINIAPHPESTYLIKKKLACKPLNQKEIQRIVSDIVNNALTEPEIAYFVSAVYKCGMSLKETEYLIKAIVKSGKKIKLRGRVVDKHCIGGIAGNRTTPIVVSICAHAGLKIPKTSSRAITSAAGTADTMETVAKVDFTIPQIKKILRKTNACMVWGGALGLAPADSKILQMEKLLHLDPESQLLASIMSKKLAVDSEYILIDIPYGKSAKVSRSKAVKLKKKFDILGEHFGVKIRCVLTEGSEPIGNGIGPALEMRDVISVLRQDPSRPRDLEKKCVKLAGEILEMTGKAEKNKGGVMAFKILKSGDALKKFQKIIVAQKGRITSSRLALGEFFYEISSGKSGKVVEIDNKKINLLGRILGSPSDKGAGIYLHKHCGQKVSNKDVLMTFYSESEDKLKEAVRFYKKLRPIKVV